MKKVISIFSMLVLLFLVACQKEGEDVFLEESSLKELPAQKPTFIDLDINHKYLSTSKGEMQSIVYMAEYITAENSGEVGNTVFFSHRGNKQIRADFVPNSIFLDYSDGTNDITYYVDNKKPSKDVEFQDSDAAIDRAMSAWNEVTCSELGITERDFDENLNTGVVAGSLGFGPYVDPINDWVADVVHAGWLPPEFFDVLAPGGSNFILGVTFSFIIIINDEIIDEDNNGKPDIWFREIYYNDNFTWNNGGRFDVETVALHEAGHGLSQGHFGKAFETNANQKVHFAPRAVMNASYTGIQTDIEKTDNGGHCSIWGEWPNN